MKGDQDHLKLREEAERGGKRKSPGVRALYWGLVFVCAVGLVILTSLSDGLSETAFGLLVLTGFILGAFVLGWAAGFEWGYKAAHRPRK